MAKSNNAPKSEERYIIKGVQVIAINTFERKSDAHKALATAQGIDGYLVQGLEIVAVRSRRSLRTGHWTHVRKDQGPDIWGRYTAPRNWEACAAELVYATNRSVNEATKALHAAKKARIVARQIARKGAPK